MAPSPDVKIDASSSSNRLSSLKSKQHFDDIQFLDYLSTDLSYLKRFILAADQMVRLLQTETARNSEIVQEKLVDTIEIAKETLSESGVSARPFIACPAPLARHRQSYFNMLSAARTLVPYVKDSDIKLRLRRLLLPLTSTSRFHVVPPSSSARPKAGNTARSATWWDRSDNGTQAVASGPAPMAKPFPLRRRTKRASVSAVKFSSSRMPYSSCSSDSASRALTSDAAANPRRMRANPYPVQTVVQSEEQSNTPLNDRESLELTHSESNTNAPPPQNAPAESPSKQKSSPPPIAYVSPMSPRPTVPPKGHTIPQSPEFPSLLQQQHRDFATGLPAYRKGLHDPPVVNWGWSSSVPVRSSLSGIDCNLPGLQSKGAPLSVLKKFTEEEYDEADENFRNGYGWRPMRWRSRPCSESPATALKWCKRWDDDLRPVPNSELVTTMLATLPSEPIQPAPLSESTCIIM